MNFSWGNVWQKVSLKNVPFVIKVKLINLLSSTWQCWRRVLAGRSTSCRNLTQAVETFLRNWAKCPNWHSFSARAQNRVDPIQAIAKTVMSRRLGRSPMSTAKSFKIVPLFPTLSCQNQSPQPHPHFIQPPSLHFPPFPLPPLLSFGAKKILSRTVQLM